MISKKAFKLFLNIEKYGHTSRLARKIDVTFSFAASTINYWKKVGLVKSKLEGRTKYLTYTQKGKLIREKLLSIENDLNLLCRGKQEVKHGRDR